jgi:hypothetical protein
LVTVTIDVAGTYLPLPITYPYANMYDVHFATLFSVPSPSFVYSTFLFLFFAPTIALSAAATAAAEGLFTLNRYHLNYIF